ncbi:MAG TPA: alpha/beta hydrolase [Chlorobaculum parvum]|uniref:Alpha/beta hydrolase n=1 Tax=Chlorobaculum parvum TaxID=274539 RepID=A0A7C5HGR8_9CHLB|nr:alpha/beta hydrolase [Chlorobaculum parvum]
MLNKQLGTIALALLLGNPATATAMSRPIEPPIPVSAENVNTNMLPPAIIKLGKVTVTPDITYLKLPGYRPMLLDLYRPKGKAVRPLIIFVHGGSWTTGSKRTTAHFTDFPRVLAHLAERGFVVASVDYRLSGEAPFPAALQDIKAAIRFLRANAGQYGIDPNRVAIWGASAGAHLGAMTAFTGKDMDFDPPGMENAEQSESVQAFVGWYGPYELRALFQQATAPDSSIDASGPMRFFGCTPEGCPPGVFAKASPVSYVDAGDPPTLLIHGTSDTTVPAEQSRQLEKRLKNAGVSAELVLIDNVSHDWAGNDEQATATASRKAINATFDWLAQQLLKGR